MMAIMVCTFSCASAHNLPSSASSPARVRVLPCCLRRYKNCCSRVERAVAPPLSYWVQKASTSLRYALFCNISVAAIAKGSGFSESQVRRMFKAKLRVTPIKYINYLRLEKAKKMLTESNFSVFEIAFATGFEDQFYFSRIFKKQYGISPLSYRFENQHK